MANKFFNFGMPIEYSDEDGNILPSGEYYFGPWNSKAEAWSKIAGTETSATFIPRGLRFGVFTSTGTQIYEFVGEKPTAGYTIDDAKEVATESKFTPTAADDTEVDYQKLKASQLKGKTPTEILDLLLFPEYSASKGTLPKRQIVNSNVLCEVGTDIATCTFSEKTAAKACQYIKDGTAYKTFTYTYVDGTVTTHVTDDATKALFKTLTRSTDATSYTVTGPDATQLASSQYLYGSKGTVSATPPLTIGSNSVSVDATSASIVGYYVCGKNGAKVNKFYVKPDGTLTTDGSTYGNSATQRVVNDATTTTDHTLASVGSVSIEVVVPTGVTYTPSISGTQFDAGSQAFIEKTALTTALNALTATTSSKTFTTTSGDSYTVTSYNYDLSGIDTKIYGKFNINLKISK